MNKYQIWECKIIIDHNIHLPGDTDCFDGVPRMVAIKAIENAGVKIISCFSGWNTRMPDISIIEDILEDQNKG